MWVEKKERERGESPVSVMVASRGCRVIYTIGRAGQYQKEKRRKNKEKKKKPQAMWGNGPGRLPSWTAGF